MLTRHELSELSRTLEEDRVLSVYLSRTDTDRSWPGIWKRRLEEALGRVRSSLEDKSTDELDAFEQASAHVRSASNSFGRDLPHQGWSAFATPDRLQHAEGLPFRPPFLVRWQPGLFASPYVRGLKSNRTVIAALVDSWRARIFRYQDGELTGPVELRAERSLNDVSDVGMAKRAASVSGVRGVTRTDYAQRVLTEERRRLRSQMAAAITGMAGTEGSVVLAGTPKAVHAARREIDGKFGDRMLEIPELSLDASRDLLAAAVGDGASALTQRRQGRLFKTCVESPYRGSMGWDDTHRALVAGAVDTLLVSRSLIESAPDDAELLVTLALAQGADIEEVGGAVGERLLSEAEGVAAWLRFKPAKSS